MGFWRYLKNKKVSMGWLIEESLQLMKEQHDINPNLLIDVNDGRCLGLGDLSLCDQWISQGNPDEQRHLEASEKKTGRWLESGKAARPVDNSV
jgi:hypothetical protein